MSRYGWLLCRDCKRYIWLGKAVLNTETKKVRYFNIVTLGDIPNSQQLIRNQALWKMMADCAGHTLQVVIEGSAEDDIDFDEYTEIGGDEYKDIDFDTYLTDWPG